MKFSMSMWFIVLQIFCQVAIAKQGTLKITGWDVYGDPDNPKKTIGYKEFEALTGKKIEFYPLSNLDDIISAAESSDDYDLFIVSNEGIKILFDMNLVIPLDLAKIPHYQSLHPNLKYSSWSQFKGQVYAAPWE